MPDILFHQYDSSPFSEKVRVCLGIKKLAWAAVDQPVIMPKPGLVALTGGYRRIPVMQIGADVYCDSQLIVRELERRYPEPTLFPQGDRGLAYANAMWSFSRPRLRSFSGGWATRYRPHSSKIARHFPGVRLTLPRCKRRLPTWRRRCAPTSRCSPISLRMGVGF